MINIRGKVITLAIISVVVVAAMIVGSLIYKVELASATPPLKPHFGGRVNDFLLCCNGIMYAIGPPRGGSYLADQNTKFFKYWQSQRKGVWFLGIYNPGGACIIPPRCRRSTPVNGVIIHVGTSLF